MLLLCRRYALTGREVNAILMQRHVKVDGKVRTDSTYPAGYMDVIDIDKTDEHFRLVYDSKGRFVTHRITKVCAHHGEVNHCTECCFRRLARVCFPLWIALIWLLWCSAGGGLLQALQGEEGAVWQRCCAIHHRPRWPHHSVPRPRHKGAEKLSECVLCDSRAAVPVLCATITPNRSHKFLMHGQVNDTIMLDLETGKIKDFIKFDIGQLCMVTGGRNQGRVGTVVHKEKHKGSFDIVLVRDSAGQEFATRSAAAVTGCCFPCMPYNLSQLGLSPSPSSQRGAK